MSRDSISVWRLEFPQPPGWRISWLGPYTSQWLTAEAEQIVRHMEAEHRVTRPHPTEPSTFTLYPGDDHLFCGCTSRPLLQRWFGDYLPRLLGQGAHIAHYKVPMDAVVEDLPDQVLFISRRATVVERSGREAPAPLIRSSAGSRTSIIAASAGKYDFPTESETTPV